MKSFLSRKILTLTRLPEPARMLLFVTVSILFAVFGLLAWEAGIVYRRAEQTLEKERRNQSKQNAVRFSRTILEPHFNNNVQIIQSTKNTRAVAGFQNSIFAATDGGLLQMTEDGAAVRHWTVLDGLPESDLTSLAVFAGKLYIGTKSKGLINFDGERFEAFRLENHETKSITGLYPTSQSLLIGTFAGGLLEFDGSRLAEIKADGARLEHVTIARDFDSCLAVGTFADGLWIRRNQIWKHFTTADSLPSNRVVGASIANQTLYVATDLGVAEMPLDGVLAENPAAFRTTFAAANLASLAFAAGKLYLTRDNGEIFVLAAGREKSGLKKIGWKAPADAASAKLSANADGIWLVCDQGVWRNQAAADELDLVEFSARSPTAETLTDNNVSALAVDRGERLWVGTFRRGIDVFSGSGKKLEHLESETAREINFLTPTAENSMLAATTDGVLRFDDRFKESFYLDNAALPSRSATQVIEFTDGKNRTVAVSTAKGLLVGEKDSKRVYSPINGLPSASIFAALKDGERLLIGTMSGLALVENGRVARAWKASNSELKNNWVSALARSADGRLFIGTYGGGVFELLPSGEIRSFETETGKFFVNPNALYADGERLLAGTLDGVRYLDLRTQKWSQMVDVLPSAVVLSIASGGENIYIGTTNGIARIKRDEFHEPRTSAD